MIFPEFENMELIDNIRNQYDPLDKLVRPHITVVCPFKSQMSNEELTQIFNNCNREGLDLKTSNLEKQEGLLLLRFIKRGYHIDMK